MFAAFDQLLLTLRVRLIPDRQRGQGMVEFALILVLIAVVTISILMVVGDPINNAFWNTVAAFDPSGQTPAQVCTRSPHIKCPK